MTISEDKLEELNIYRRIILNPQVKDIFLKCNDNDPFGTLEIHKHSSHYKGFFGISLKITCVDDKGNLKYELRSSKFMRSSNLINGLYSIEGVEDIYITNSKNLVLIYDMEYLLNYIQREDFLNHIKRLEILNYNISLNSVNKFNL